MRIHTNLSSIGKVTDNYYQHNKRIGFVPTMGCIHAGHLKLIEVAREHNDIVIASIFVNPMQFGPEEDFHKYPRPLEEDQQLLQAHGVDHLLLPEVSEIYTRPLDEHTVVHVPRVSEILCGIKRTGHFDGVCTVVLKLLLGVRPHQIILGEKDYQQLVTIECMVQDLGVPVEVVGVPTVREEDGLALSSRNRYLSSEERLRATVLYKSLVATQEQWAEGERNIDALEKKAHADLAHGVDSIEYWAVCSTPDLMPLSGTVSKNTQAIVCACVSISNTRLIDNITCGSIITHIKGKGKFI